MRFCFFLFLYFTVFVCKLFGQNDLRFTRIGEKEGLKNPTVYDIVQDEDGFMWFGTADGLHRFDTKNIRTFLPDSTQKNKLKHEKILSLLIDSKKRFWVGTEKGVQLFDRLTEKFTDFLLINQGKPAGVVVAINEDREGNIWFGTNIGVFCLSNQNVQFYECPKDVVVTNFDKSNFISGHVLHDKNGKYWCSVWLDHYSVTEIDVKNKKILAPNFLTYDSHNSSVIKPVAQVELPELLEKIFEDSRGNIWFASFMGLYRYQPDKKVYTLYSNKTNEKGSLPSRAKDICEDKNGTIWVGTYGGGLCRYHPKTETFTSYSHNPYNQNSLGSDYVRCLYLDSDENIWVGTNHGVSILNPLDNQFEVIAPILENSQGATLGNFRIDEDENGVIWSRVIKGKEFLGAAYYGIYGYNPAAQEFIKVPFPKRSRIFQRLSDTTLLIQRIDDNQETFKKDFLYIWNTKRYTATPYKIFKTDSWMCADFVFYEKDEKLWIANYTTGFFRLTRGSLNFYTNPQEKDFKHNFFHSLALQDSDGKIWISGYSDRLYYFDPSQVPQTLDNYDLKLNCNIQTDSVILNQLIPIFLKKENDTKNYTTALLEDEDEILLATSDLGIVVVDKKSKKIKKTYTKNDGLIQNTIYGMLRDRQGFFWLSHPKGITKWDKKKGHFEHYFVQIDLPTVGMKEQGTFSGTAYLSPFTGKIYFGTDEGLIVFQPEKLKQNDKKPNVFISKCRVLGKEYALDSAINVKKEIVLPYDENFINFELAALNYSNFQLNQYAYCMENFEKNWVELGTKNEAIYTNLPPGEYIFRFRASNDKGIWNEEGNFIRVVILPPWWATWWFRFSAFVFILASIRTVYKLRVNRLENRSFLLEKTVQERTLEIAEQKAKISAALAHNKAITDALDSSAVVSITDLRGRIVKANQIFERVSGYTHEEIIGQDHRLVNSGYHPKSFWIEMWKTIALGKTWRAEVCNRAKNGEIYWVDTVINPVFDENGKIYQYLSIRTLITQRKNAEKIIQEQNAELQENLTQLTILRQNSEESRIKVEHLLQNFTRSVNYALRIQEAIIPKEKELQKYWDCFVYFRPKDIVSGDFYWFADKGHTKILAVADCTGHGVSGAFMTMIGNNILNQIVHDYEIHEPDEILNLMPLLLEKTLLHSEGKIKDGMDISVIAVETEKDEKGNEIIARISYAGAMNPLFLVKNHQFMEIKADKKPISGVIDDNFAYKKHEILINENHFAAVPEMYEKGIFSATPEYSETEQCVLYLCSDGFQDQFGGADDKKFMVKNFKKLLFDISEKPIFEQKEILEQTFETWKGNQEQTDDVMVLGIKIV